MCKYPKAYLIIFTLLNLRTVYVLFIFDETIVHEITEYSEQSLLNASAVSTYLITSNKTLSQHCPNKKNSTNADVH